MRSKGQKVEGEQRRSEEKTDRCEEKGQYRSEARHSRRDSWRFERMGLDKENTILGE